MPSFLRADFTEWAAPERSWRAWADPRGWFWATDPKPLAWASHDEGQFTKWVTKELPWVYTIEQMPISSDFMVFKVSWSEKNGEKNQFLPPAETLAAAQLTASRHHRHRITNRPTEAVSAPVLPRG
jgi:hypothetical protein